MSKTGLIETADNADQPASILKRGTAYLVDVLAVSPYVGVLLALGSIFPGLRTLFSDSEHAELFQFLLLTFPVGCWFVLTESSSWRATPGKLLLQMKVSYDRRLGILPAAVLRNCAKLAPWELNHALMWHVRLTRGAFDTTALFLVVSTWTLLLLYIAGALMNPRHRTPYDFLSGVTVVEARALVDRLSPKRRNRSQFISEE